MRKQLDTPAKLEYELAFQPSHLELVETPPHPAPRFTARVITALVVIVLTIAVFGRLDIVVAGKGKLVPNAQVKMMQPAVTGVVREIAVHDGERVAIGKVLLRLDTAQAAADENKAQASLLDAALAIARSKALIAAQQLGTQPQVAGVDGATAQRQQEAQRLAEGTWLEYQDKLSSAKAELLKRTAALDSTRQEIAKLAATAPLARKQANEYKTLSTDKYVAQNDYLDKERSALEQEHELDAQRSHARELAAGIAEQQADISAAASQFRHEQLDQFEKASEQLAQNRNDEKKANTRTGLMSLSSPVTGTVQQLAVHTLGGVVTTAQVVMEIVPDDALEIQAIIENKDIGFVKIGQRVAVKLEAFPYTRYGMMEGTVLSIANDAVQDKKLGLAFVVRVHLTSNRMQIGNRWVDLTPGMAATVEIKTGRQRVAQYFLGPLVDAAQESLHER